MEIPVRKFRHSSSCLIPSHGCAGAKVHRSRPALSLSPKIGVSPLHPHGGEMKSLTLGSPASRKLRRRDCFYLFALSLVVGVAPAMGQYDLNTEHSARAVGSGVSSNAIGGS